MPNQTKTHIQQALQQFQHGSLRESSLHLLATLGYQSDRQMEMDNAPGAFLQNYDPSQSLRQDKALFADWLTADILCQIGDWEIRQDKQRQLFDSAGKVIDGAIIESYVFMAIALSGEQYTRTQLAQITREINKLFPMPVNLFFRHGQTLTIAIINRRLNKKDGSKDVLEKVTLIKDIRLTNPHRAHVEILFDLSLAELFRVYSCDNFVALHQAWQKTLDSSELNKKFFNEVANWYFWAVNEVVFPAAAGPDETRNATSMIRLITRLIFVWFLKEKGVIPDDLFNERKLKSMLRWEDPQDSAYYKAILQNLFFATLNQEMNTPAKPDNRKFRGTRESGQSQHFMIHNVYRYEKYFRDPAAALALFADIPFLNGGLFECLDKRIDGQDVRIDGFSDRPDNPLRVPDDLFFGPERTIDLNETYGTSGKSYRVRGLIETLNRYKFTITENTPIEEEIALDPELLGKVFENLLAAYNPETGTTARKQTGSFYTPREIVNYMVDESLLAYLQTKVRSNRFSGSTAEAVTTNRDMNLEERLRHLFAYNEEAPQFNAAEKALLIDAIDHVNILDPACGSGAFPMGILHKLVFILGKLDPHNELWKERQIEPMRAAIQAALAIPDTKIRARAVEELEEQIVAIEQAFTHNELDYGRKLYLIENCIYGVDIQPVAVQIAKLRFFISLVVDQRLNDHAPNRGILPLPNLETKFVAANTLLGIEKPQQLALRNPAITAKEKELAEVRSKHFRARTPQTKEKWRLEDKRLRAEIGALLQKDGFPNETTTKLAHWDPYNQNASADFFDMEWMFGLEDGFDVVIGNPPYLESRSPDFSAHLKDSLQQGVQIRWGNIDSKLITRGSDLLIYFFEVSLKLLKNNGLVVLITQNSWLDTEYGFKFQNFLLRHTNVIAIIDSDYKHFDTANINTVISIFRGTMPVKNGTTSFFKFHERFDQIPVDFLNLSPRNINNQWVKKYVYPQASSVMKNTKWGMLLSANVIVLQLMDLLAQKASELESVFQNSVSVGQGLNLTKDYIVDEELVKQNPLIRKALIPIVTNEDHAQFVLVQTKNFLVNNDLLNLSQRESLLTKGIRLFDPNSTSKIPPVLILPRGIGRHYCTLNYANAYSASAVDIYDFSGRITEKEKFNLWLFLNSSICWLLREASGRKNLGGGMLKAEATDLKKIPIYLNFDRHSEIQDIISELSQRAALPIIEEIQTTEHQKIDQIVFDYLDIPNEMRTRIFNELIEQVLSREGKPRAHTDWKVQDLTQPEIIEVISHNIRHESLPGGSEPPGSLATEQPPAPAAKAAIPSAPPLIFTGQPPQGSFSAKRARLETLTKQATPAAIQELTAALMDENLTIRWQASSALRTIGGPQVASTLQAFIHQTNNPAAKAEAEKLLAYIES